MQEKNNLSISGAGVVAGGEYGCVKFSGSGRVDGDLKCDELRCSGSVKVAGGVECSGEIRVSGSFKAEGSVRSDDLRISGSCHIDGGFHGGNLTSSGGLHIGDAAVAGDVSCSGGCAVGGNFHAQKIKASGKLTVEGDCEAEQLEAWGLEVKGLLNCGSVLIHLDNCDGRAGEIGGETIRILREKTGNRGWVIGIGRVHSRGYGTFYTDTIEGDTVELENTEAKTVRGATVVIGAGCRIDTVEYSGTLRVDPEAAVKKQVKI